MPSRKEKSHHLIKLQKILDADRALVEAASCLRDQSLIHSADKVDRIRLDLAGQFEAIQDKAYKAVEDLAKKKTKRS